MSFFGNVEENRISGWITTEVTPLSCSPEEGGNCEGMDPVPAFSEPINLIFNGEISYHEDIGYCLFEMDFTMDMPGGICDGDTGTVIMYFCPRETPFSPCELIDACPTPADGV